MPLEMPKFNPPTDLPSVKFMNPDPPDAAVPVADGDYYDALVPDTCNLEERARLFVDQYLSNIVVPELMCEPYNLGLFEVTPPRLALDRGSYLCAWAKYRESLPLMRMMSGSRVGLEIDEAWARHLLKCIGPDGLFWVPLVGRPWETILAYPWLKIDSGAEFYTNLFIGQGRLLGALSIYYAMTGDEVWNRTARGIVDRLNEMATRVDGVAFFPQFYLVYGQSISNEIVKNGIEQWNQWKSKGQDKEAWSKTAGEDPQNTALWQTWIATGLAQYYRASGYEPARDLAYGIVNYLRATRYVEDWASHFHCITLGIHAMLELAQATGDMELADYARRAYDEAKSGRRMIALPEIGYFVNDTAAKDMEGCSVGDMVAIAAKLAQMGLGDEYWEDLDRYTRNLLMEAQRTTPEQTEIVFHRLAETHNLSEAPVAYNEIADHVAERIIGSFLSSFYPNDSFALSYFDSCCSGNCSRALYYAWESILSYDGGGLTVNLLLNRTSPWADINSHIPNSGRVDIEVKRHCKAFSIRMNNWIAKDKITCEINGNSRSFGWNGSYLVLENAAPGDKITLKFPMREESKILNSFGHGYISAFRGNECVDIEPKGDYYSMFQRDYCRGHVRFVKTKRFVCQKTLWR